MQVKDLIQYLQKFDPFTEVVLDKNGWTDGIDSEKEVSNEELIKNSGLFHFSKHAKVLVINN